MRRCHPSLPLLSHTTGHPSHNPASRGGLEVSPLPPLARAAGRGPFPLCLRAPHPARHWLRAGGHRWLRHSGERIRGDVEERPCHFVARGRRPPGMSLSWLGTHLGSHASSPSLLLLRTSNSTPLADPLLQGHTPLSAPIFPLAHARRATPVSIRPTHPPLPRPLKLCLSMFDRLSSS